MADWYVSSVANAAIPQWAASTAYTVGQIVRPLATPTVYTAGAYRCTTAGTSGASEPSWGYNNNTTTNSGTAVFTNVTGQSAYGWSAAALTVAHFTQVFTAKAAAGDRIFVSSDHSESISTANYGFTTGAFGAVQVLSVNRAGSVPPVAADLLAGATIVNTSGVLTIDPLVNTFWQGITFNQSANGNWYINNNGGKENYFKNCSLVNSGAAAASAVLRNNSISKIVFDNTTFTFNNASQNIGASGYGFDLTWINTANAVQGTQPTTLFVGGNYNIQNITCRGVDFSGYTGTLFSSSNGFTNASAALLDGCRISSAGTRYATPAVTAFVSEILELVNCYDGSSFISERYVPAGVLTTDRGVYLSGGAQDSVSTFSHKLVSSTRSDIYVHSLDTFYLDVENVLVGASKTATVEVVSNATLTTNDIRLEVEYLGTSGSPVASFADTLVTPLTAAANHPTSTATWVGATGLTKQKLQVTFTPQTQGRVRGRVRLGKVSQTVYVNPQLTIS